MLTKHKLLAVLGLLYGAVTWGLIWYPYRRMEDMGLDATTSTFLTYLVAGALGLILFGGKLRLRSGMLGVLLVLALAAGWTNLAYVLAVVGGEVMRVLLLFYLAPLWTVLFSRSMLGERPNRSGYIVMLLSFAGAMVMLWKPGGGPPLPANEAEWLGLFAGLMFAFTNVLSRRVMSASIPLKSMTIFLGVILLSGLPMLSAPEKLAVISQLSALAWVWVVATAVALLLVTVAVQYGLAHTPANQAIVIFLFELVVAAISAYYLANEVMSLQEWLGGTMIVTASLFSGKLEHKP